MIFACSLNLISATWLQLVMANFIKVPRKGTSDIFMNPEHIVSFSELPGGEREEIEIRSVNDKATKCSLTVKELVRMIENAS